ncbi:MAG: hypothetical protein QGF46_02275, partial [Planctomycetota bacterium]|nr:hypothetical protein [Planctomycetota bacterium]
RPFLMYIPLQMSRMLLNHLATGQFSSAGAITGTLDQNGGASGTFSFSPDALVNRIGNKFAYCVQMINVPQR